ncbi:hypothetical protein JTE90_028548 [Oedothorax gibbosus]|uniref:Uncharacterized protein n=1 Tax=Oedothorax gibbosus TaxID=931172 RepID=A0AAV6VTU3_9ARAC|nr:hypothetical protein JTE90_028548 [Oedothorax gibbosus]
MKELRTVGLLLLMFAIFAASEEEDVWKRAQVDDSIGSYYSERVCWWNEVCKREFQVRFRCRCPKWSFCRSPGRYYDAHCAITRTGYIWMQD